MAQSILKLTHQEAVVKVWGPANTTETVDLSGLVAAGQVLDGAVQTVNIVGVTWTGQDIATIAVERGDERVMTLPPSGASSIDFTGQSLPPDTTENTSDLVVTIVGGVGEVWLKLRKVGGYKTTIEPEQFGPYDNPAVAGS